MASLYCRKCQAKLGTLDGRVKGIAELRCHICGYTGRFGSKEQLLDQSTTTGSSPKFTTMLIKPQNKNSPF